MNLSQRSHLSELMDDPALPRADYDRCLHDLAAVNRVTLTHRPTLRWLDRVTRTLPADRAVSILDVACGQGDLLRAIHRWAKEVLQRVLGEARRTVVILPGWVNERIVHRRRSVIH